MKCWWLICAVFALCCSAIAGGPPVLEPVMQGENSATEQHAGKSYPVFRAASDQKLVDAIGQVFATSFAGEMERLYILGRSVAHSPESATPLYLLLSQEEGGYARRDFFLQSATGQRTFISADYVDLVVDNESVQSGDFEEIFSHELGHLILRTLTGELLGPRSNKMHQSMTLTDYRTAFDEGFAEHFQPLARENSMNPNLVRQQRGAPAPPLNQEFLSQRDQLLRNFGPQQNLFIHDRFVPACTSPRECYVLEETSTSFDPAQLRTGQQMLSSEGVVATTFLYLVSANALPTCIPRNGVAPDCSALESQYKQIFEALAALKLNPTQSPLIAMLQSYRAKFPEEGKRATTDFLLLTRGATASLDLLHGAEELDRASARVDIAVFRTRLHSLRDLLKQVTDDVLAGKSQLDAAVGPELWIRNQAFTHSSLWNPAGEAPLRISLNTASAEELATLPQFSADNAHAIVRERKQRGYFSSINQMVEVLKLTPAQADVLKQAEQSQATAEPDPVQ